MICIMNSVNGLSVTVIKGRPMDTKQRIKELMHERGWTMYELAKRSGIAQTTLTNMWNRNTEPSIPTLTEICKAFDITLSQFFAEGKSIELTPKQCEFFKYWCCLTEEQQDLLLALGKTIR